MGLIPIWVVLTAAMILLMEGGFALLEAGFVRQKNAVSIIMKVFVDITFGALIFYFFGFGLMYGKDTRRIDWHQLALCCSGDFTHIQLNISHDTYWLFQCAFVIAVISIVSGAVAERIHFQSLHSLYHCNDRLDLSDCWTLGLGRRRLASASSA